MWPVRERKKLLSQKKKKKKEERQEEDSQTENTRLVCCSSLFFFYLEVMKYTSVSHCPSGVPAAIAGSLIVAGALGCVPAASRRLQVAA